MAVEPDASSAERLNQLSRRGGARVAGFILTIVVVGGLFVFAFSAIPTSPAGTSAENGTYRTYVGGYSQTTVDNFHSSPPSPPTSTGTSVPDVSLTSGDALTQLTALAREDRPELASGAVGYWIPQLSSKKPGMAADGIIYDHTAILADHTRLRSAYPGTKLVWSGDWASFRNQDYWVTVAAGQRFTTAQAANAWCDQQGFDKDSCFAKRLMTSGGYDGNTRPR